MTTGLVVVDLQNEYLATGKLPLTGMDAATKNAVQVISHARKNGIPVFHIRHESADEAAAIFAKGSDGAKIQSAVLPQGEEPVVVKAHINAFRETALDKHLDAAGVEQIVVIGAMSHMCVDAVVRAAADMDYPVTVLHDACATLDLEFNGVKVPAAQVHAAMMAAFAFGYATVKSVDEYLAD